MPPTALDSWMTDADADARMTVEHAPLWARMIELIEEQDLSRACVLDFGCNQGGFLRLLHDTRPFLSGIGLDLARAAISIAEQRRGARPIAYRVASEWMAEPGTIDLACSHEVLYLLSDLDAHAAFMARILAPGGVYYAALGCHTDNPLWPRWRELIPASSNLPVHDYSLADCAAAFTGAGFAVAVRPFTLEEDIRSGGDSAYYPTPESRRAYFMQHKTLFRFARR